MKVLCSPNLLTNFLPITGDDGGEVNRLKAVIQSYEKEVNELGDKVRSLETEMESKDRERQNSVPAPEKDKYKSRVFAVRTDTVPWKESLKLPSDQQRCIIIWRQLSPDTGSQTQTQTHSKKAKMVEESASFEPWMMITESAALKQISVPKTPNGVDTHGLYMLKDLKPYFDKRRNAHSVSKEILGYYSGMPHWQCAHEQNIKWTKHRPAT